MLILSKRLRLLPRTGPTSSHSDQSARHKPYKSAADANGSVTITVTATDNGSTGGPHENTTLQTFIITVEPVNDAPALDVVSDQTVAEGAGIQNIAITGVSSGGGSDEANQTVTLTVTSGNPEANRIFSRGVAHDANHGLEVCSVELTDTRSQQNF